jgi:hypothetical protein
VRNEISRLRGQIRSQEREIRMLLSRMRAKVDDLCREREALREAEGSLAGRS